MPSPAPSSSAKSRDGAARKRRVVHEQDLHAVEHRFSRAQWLAEVLQQRIISGAYQPGEHLREAQLRQEFGFSNGPIREALQKMVLDGLAESEPWQGVRVKQLSERQIVELFQVRLALLEYAAELAARNVSPEMQKSGAAVKRGLDQGFSEIDASAGHLSFNGKLSQWLVASAGNEALREIWDKTMRQTLIYVNASMKRSLDGKSRGHIHALIDGICGGDVKGARAAARALTQQTLLDLGIDQTV